MGVVVGDIYLMFLLNRVYPCLRVFFVVRLQ